MKRLAQLLLLAAGVAAAPLLPARAAPHAAGHALSPADRAQLFRATALAGRSTRGAVTWLQHHGIQAATGRDGTVSLQFSDGAQAAILRRSTFVGRNASHLRTVTHFAPRTIVRQTPGGNRRALVLEPFADQINPQSPDTYGQDEVNALTQAGFQVDVKRDTDVTIGVMQHLADYSFVYMETHSNPLPDTGDVIIVVRQTDNQDYTAYFQDGTVMQATVAGDPNHSLFLAIKSSFFARHVGTFADSSIFFLNGCDVLGSPQLLGVLQQQNLGALISWDQEVYSYREAGPMVLQKLAQGETVAQTVQDVRNAGPGISIGPGTLAKLDFNGDGTDTLARALIAAPVPTATPTSTPTVTSTPAVTATPVKTPKPTKKHRHKPKPKPTATPKPKPTAKPRPKPTARPLILPTVTPEPSHLSSCHAGYHRVHGKCQPIKKKCTKTKGCKAK